MSASMQMSTGSGYNIIETLVSAPEIHKMDINKTEYSCFSQKTDFQTHINAYLNVI